MEVAMEVSIQEVARLAGTTSRTLRHYDAIGLLPPSRTGDNGYRWYDEASLVRLQRILLLRDLGLPLPEIGRVLDRERDEATALRQHLGWLRSERERLARQIASVERTITAREDGGRLMAEEMLDGFDHTVHREEVEQRWGADAYAAGDRWWRGMSAGDRAAWTEKSAALGRDWTAAAEAGADPAGPVAQALAERHARWLGSIPGTPRAARTGRTAPTSTDAGSGAQPDVDLDYLRGLGDMYVADDRFAANYGGLRGATLVRSALHAWADAQA